MDNLMAKISELHNKLLESKNSIYKLKDIDECKISLGIQLNQTFGDYYYKLAGRDKLTGSVYTPEYIAEYMIENTIKKEDIVMNPYLKIIDPSCGVGNIIIPCFKYLKKLFLENLDEINIRNNINIIAEKIDFHIITHNLYGIDIDLNVLVILQIDLFYISGYINNCNYIHDDFLKMKSLRDG
jgi:adenine-specific DNA-methyltransferase